MRHGCHTVIASRSLPRVSMAARKLAAATGQRCLPLSLDVRAPLAIMAAVEQALKEFGKIDILINCDALSSNAFKTVMDIDTLGTFNVSRVLYEKFFHDHGGVIVNITATLGTRGQVLQRLGNKTEIAHSALFLASPLASYVTGALLVVDGDSVRQRSWSAPALGSLRPASRLPSLSAKPDNPSRDYGNQGCLKHPFPASSWTLKVEKQEC
ncbi:hypothetical protein E2I00_007300, partial [Balaenoptera physalus]